MQLAKRIRTCPLCICSTSCFSFCIYNFIDLLCKLCAFTINYVEIFICERKIDRVFLQSFFSLIPLWKRVFVHLHAKWKFYYATSKLKNICLIKLNWFHFYVKETHAIRTRTRTHTEKEIINFECIHVEIDIVTFRVTHTQVRTHIHTHIKWTEN